MGPGGYWGLTKTTAPDQVALVRTIAYPNALLTTADRNYELKLMRNVIPSQKWGISAGVPSGASVALKNGWLFANGTWNINSIGNVNGGGLDYVLAILTNRNGTEGYGIDTVEGLSQLIVPELARPDPSASAPSADRLDLVRRTTNGSVEYLYWTKTGWSKPVSLGGVTIGSPWLVANAEEVAMFARGSGADEIWWRRSTGDTWGGWAAVPGQTPGWATSSAAAVVNADDSIELFVRGGDGALWTTTWSTGGTWSKWSSLDGALASGPAACEAADGSVTLAIVGTDDETWTGTLQAGGTWSGWTSRGGLVVNGDPAVVCDGAGAELFARDAGALSLWTRTFAGTWTKVGGALGSGPSADLRGGSVDVTVLGPNGVTYVSTRDGSGTWSSWHRIP
jgi:hypothetical protein